MAIFITFSPTLSHVVVKACSGKARLKRVLKDGIHQILAASVPLALMNQKR